MYKVTYYNILINRRADRYFDDKDQALAFAREDSTAAYIGESDDYQQTKEL
ncbi:MAG: hypothetical protein LBP62_05660 [Clostridiales bacterium]|jgi:hypothetical protein|nr:hypothetical protein [Clostridiales bacterium]